MYIFLYNGDVLGSREIEISNVAPNVIIDGCLTIPMVEILRIKEQYDEWFGEVRWCDDDIAEALMDRGIELSEENIGKVRDEIKSNHGFQDAIIETGWDAMNAIISALGLEKIDTEAPVRPGSETEGREWKTIG